MYRLGKYHARRNIVKMVQEIMKKHSSAHRYRAIAKISNTTVSIIIIYLVYLWNHSKSSPDKKKARDVRVKT